MSRRTLRGAFACFLVAAVTAVSHAQLSLTGGNAAMSVTTSLLGQEPLAVTNSQCTLTWQRPDVATKLTVSTTCPGQRFTLRVLATNLRNKSGVAAPEVTLQNGMPAVDFVTDIPRTGALNKSATLLYTASATFSQGNSTELGDDVHTVTYTLVAQ